MKFALWVFIRTSEIKTEYCFFKDAERIVFMAIGVVEMMRFLYAKVNLKGGISDTKIGHKSGNLIADFLHFGGSVGKSLQRHPDHSVGQ